MNGVKFPDLARLGNQGKWGGLKRSNEFFDLLGRAWADVSAHSEFLFNQKIIDLWEGVKSGTVGRGEDGVQAMDTCIKTILKGLRDVGVCLK